MKGKAGEAVKLEEAVEQNKSNQAEVEREDVNMPSRTKAVNQYDE